MGESRRTWPAELDNDACAGPLQPDELARWDRSRKQTRAWMVAFFVLLACAVALAVATFRRMGDPAPLHVGPGGVDRWGSRTEYLTSCLVALGAVTVFGPGLVWLIPRLPMSVTNSTSPAYWKTPERYPASTAHANVFLLATMTTLVVMFLGAEAGFWRLATGHSFPEWFMLLPLGLLAVQTVTGIVLLVRAMRPPQWWRDCRHAHGHRWD